MKRFSRKWLISLLFLLLFSLSMISCGGSKTSTSIVLQADLSNISGESLGDVMDGEMNVIRNRLDAYGIGGATVQRQGDEQILIEIARSVDVEEVTKLVSQQGMLDFREHPEGNDTNWVVAAATGSDGLTHNLTGVYLKPNAKVEVPSSGTNQNQPGVAIEFNTEGAKLFEEITYRNWHKQLAIFVDDQVTTVATVLPDSSTQQGIVGGKAIISGANMDISACRTLVAQLNAGAMPVPLSVVSVGVTS